MKIEEALQQIYSMHQFSIKLGLENIENLIKYLGNPEKKLIYFHIAGSNGKGSTASFIASILMEAGYKTGLYTSPHLVKFNERIRVNEEMINDDFITEFLNKHHNYILESNPTFFEITTAIAFDYFASQKPDFVVLETGLGGRLDATNIINPLASVITSISFEHQNILGDSLSAIAGEKAGIIKSDGKTFTGLLPAEAELVISKKAFEKNNDFYRLSDFINFSEDVLLLEVQDEIFTIPSLPLKGKYQKLNAALALLVLNETFGIKDKNIIEKGFANVVTNTGIAGRYEIYSEKPKVIFDAAHNEEGIKVFTEEFSREYKKYGNRKVIFGAMRDKNIPVMIKALKPYFDEFIFTEIPYERALKSEELEDLVKNLGIKTSRTKYPEKIIDDFCKNGTNDCIVVLGSIYLLGKIKENLSLQNFT